MRVRDKDGERRDRNRLATKKDSFICHFNVTLYSTLVFIIDQVVDIALACLAHSVPQNQTEQTHFNTSALCSIYHCCQRHTFLRFNVKTFFTTSEHAQIPC